MNASSQESLPLYTSEIYDQVIDLSVEKPADCKCPTHLFSFKRQPTFADLKQMIRQAFPEDQAIRRVTLMPKNRHTLKTSSGC